MTPKQAAVIIGCHHFSALRLIRDGKLPAKQVQDKNYPGQYVYDVKKADAERCRDSYEPTRGRPRGSGKQRQHKDTA